MYKRCLVAMGIVLSILPGCGIKTSYSTMKAGDEIVTLGITPDFNYEKTEQKPGIIIDCEGYLPTGKKMVYLLAEEVNRRFYVVNMDNEERVYESSLSKLEDAGGNIVYTGDFSELTAPGRYRIYQSDLGYSHEFVIDENIYIKSYKELYKGITNLTYKNTRDIIYVLTSLMTIKEVYENSYINEGFIEENIELLLKHQNAKTGAVYQEILSDNELESIGTDADNGDGQYDNLISLSATAEFAGVMAQYYYLYQEKEPEMAQRCIKAANLSYTYMEQYKDNVPGDSYYYAAAQLYKATGAIKCRTAIATYDAMDVKTKSISDYNYEILADISYMKSKFRTDYSRCDAIMSEYLADAGKISNKSSRYNFYVASDIGQSNLDEILDDMMKLGLVSYIISGREYYSIQGNYIHYLSGANEENKNYLKEEIPNTTDASTENIIKMLKLLFVFGNFQSV